MFVILWSGCHVWGGGGWGVGGSGCCVRVLPLIVQLSVGFLIGGDSSLASFFVGSVARPGILELVYTDMFKQLMD